MTRAKGKSSKETTGIVDRMDGRPGRDRARIGQGGLVWYMTRALRLLQVDGVVPHVTIAAPSSLYSQACSLVYWG